VVEKSSHLAFTPRVDDIRDATYDLFSDAYHRESSEYLRPIGGHPWGSWKVRFSAWLAGVQNWLGRLTHIMTGMIIQA